MLLLYSGQDVNILQAAVFLSEKRITAFHFYVHILVHVEFIRPDLDHGCCDIRAVVGHSLVVREDILQQYSGLHRAQCVFP